MPDKVKDKLENILTTLEELISIAKNNFPNMQVEEGERLVFLRKLLFHPKARDHKDDLLEILFQNPSVPLKKLEARYLVAMGTVDIKTIKVFMLAIKMLQDSEEFLVNIRNNTILYKQFEESYKSEVNEFNNDISAKVVALENASTLAEIESIKNLEKDIIEKRMLLTNKYPEKALSEEVKSSMLLSEIEVFVEAVNMAEERVKELDSVNNILKERIAKFNSFYDNNNFNQAFTVAWQELQDADWNVHHVSSKWEDKKNKPKNAYKPS